MTQITLDATLATRLHELCQVVEFCDPSGQVIGRFVPKPNLSGWEAVSPDMSEEELDRREQETESFTTAEVLAYLGNMNCSGSDGGSAH
jgi:hypothetical protein